MNENNKENTLVSEFDLKSEIKSLGMTQLEFSKIVGIHNNSLTQWITGKRQMPEWIKNFIYHYRKSKMFDSIKKQINQTNIL